MASSKVKDMGQQPAKVKDKNATVADTGLQPGKVKDKNATVQNATVKDKNATLTVKDIEHGDEDIEHGDEHDNADQDTDPYEADDSYGFWERDSRMQADEMEASRLRDRKRKAKWCNW